MNALPAIATLALRATAQIVSPGGRRASLLVVMYHRVFETVDPLLPGEPDAQRFAAHMGLISSLFNVLPLEEAVLRLQRGTLPPRALCITFDDGYSNNLDVAAPILHAMGLPATIFVTTGFLDGGCMWNDLVIETIRRAKSPLDLSDLGLGSLQVSGWQQKQLAIKTVIDGVKYLEPPVRADRVRQIVERANVRLPERLMMSEQQVRKLRDFGIAVGAHTETHPILNRIDDRQARQEILLSKQRLEQVLGESVNSFAYPNGRPGQDYSPRHVELARDAGFKVAVTTGWGAARMGADTLQIPRVAPWDATAFRYAVRLVKSYTQRPAAAVTTAHEEGG